MRHSDMVVTRSTGILRTVGIAVTRILVAVVLAVTAIVVAPTAALAASSQSVAVAAGPAPSAGSLRTEAPICRPEPPDYPGCTVEQVRPLLRARFATEYTGHAYGYRYYRMGQHHKGVIFAHLLPALNAKLARLYHEAVVRYEAQHTTVVVRGDGVQHEVVSYPRYLTWAGFRANTTSFCNADNVTIRFPSQYCWSVTKLGQAGAVINSLLRSTLRIALSCNGYAIGGWASGSFAAWRLGTGILAGGFYGGVGVEIGCQTRNLWNWVTNLW